MKHCQEKTILETIANNCYGRISFVYRQAGCLPMAVKDSMPSACIVSSRLCDIYHPGMLQ